MARSITYRGRIFPSQVALAKFLGVTPHTVGAARREGRVGLLERRDGDGGSVRPRLGSRSRLYEPVTIRDQTFPDGFAAAAFHRVKPVSVLAAINRGTLDRVGLKRAYRGKSAPPPPPPGAEIDDDAPAPRLPRAIKACLRCGTRDALTETWAIPLEEGGLESGWNVHVLCDPCRAVRKGQEETQAAESVKQRDRIKAGLARAERRPYAAQADRTTPPPR